jgi:hypothetical protein
MSSEMEPLSIEARLIADLGVQVARLTHQVAYRDMIIEELKHEVKTERPAVVAWLREVAPSAPTRRGADELAWCADIIERGEHRRKDSDGIDFLRANGVEVTYTSGPTDPRLPVPKEDK